MKTNDGARGTWHESGTYWFCDCIGGGGAPLLNIHFGMGGRRSSKKQAPSVSRCPRCEVLRPLKRDRPMPFAA